MMLLLCAATYIFGALGYYTIARRRGIEKSWLAFVPVGNQWILGGLSDQYQLMVNFKTKRKASLLLWLNIATLITLALFLVSLAVTVLSAQNVDPTYSSFIDVWAPVRRNLQDMLWVYLLMMAAVSALAVVQYMALYDLYRSCDPENSVLWLLLSIFLGLAPFLVFACRKRDLGMPSSMIAKSPMEPWQMNM